MFGYKIYSSIFGGWMGSSSQYFINVLQVCIYKSEKANFKNQL